MGGAGLYARLFYPAGGGVYCVDETEADRGGGERWAGGFELWAMGEWAGGADLRPADVCVRLAAGVSDPTDAVFHLCALGHGAVCLWAAGNADFEVSDILSSSSGAAADRGPG